MQLRSPLYGHFHKQQRHFNVFDQTCTIMKNCQKKSNIFVDVQWGKNNGLFKRVYNKLVKINYTVI